MERRSTRSANRSNTPQSPQAGRKLRSTRSRSHDIDDARNKQHGNGDPGSDLQSKNDRSAPVRRRQAKAPRQESMPVFDCKTYCGQIG